MDAHFDVREYAQLAKEYASFVTAMTNQTQLPPLLHPNNRTLPP
jgi:hypothetical protein